MSAVVRFVLAVGGGLALGSPAKAAVITTFPNWNGTGGGYGQYAIDPGSRAALGQTFTVGATDTLLTSASLAVWSSYVAGFPLEFALMQWNPATSRAVGPVLFQETRTLTTSPAYQTLTFAPSVALTPNTQYILFGVSDPAAAGPVFNPNTGRSGQGVGFVLPNVPPFGAGNPYTGGQAWFTGGIGTVSQVATGSSWGSAGITPGQDLVFSVNLTAAPVPSGLVLLLTATPVLAVAARFRRM